MIARSGTFKVWTTPPEEEEQSGGLLPQAESVQKVDFIDAHHLESDPQTSGLDVEIGTPTTI